MKLVARYKKLSTWNKIGFWGAIASIIGVPLFFLPSQKTSPAIAVENSPGTMVQHSSPNSVQIGSLSIAADTQRYRDPAPEVQKQLRQNLQSFKQSYPDVAVRIDAESGLSARFKAAKTLGQFTRDAGVGDFDPSSTHIGIFPGFPITVVCSSNHIATAHEFILAIRPYLNGTVNLNVREVVGAPFFRLYINGSPSFLADGKVLIE